MDGGFVKAFSDNLPEVSFEMVCAFTSNTDYINIEVRHGKTKRLTRESYGDNAIGYVQLKRENEMCIVKAKMTPEHKIYKKNYNVIINEEEKTVEECKCCDCSASEGGCKHAIAFLFWLQRRSEEPAITSKECFWKKSNIVTSVKDKKVSTLKDLVDKEIPPCKDFGGRFLERVKTLKFKGGLFDFYTPTYFEELSVHHLMINFQNTNIDRSADSFLVYVGSMMSNENCTKAEIDTREQSKSLLWYCAYILYIQMLLTRRSKALFCVASPNFENDKHVDIFSVDFNENECKDILALAQSFWKQHIYPNLL